MKPISVLLTVVLLSFVSNAQSQQLANPIDHALLNIYSQLYVYPQEKVYVQKPNLANYTKYIECLIKLEEFGKTEKIIKKQIKL